MNPIVIIGTGLGGYTLAREFRKLDKDTPLRLLTADSGHFYSKPMLSNAFHNGKTADTLATHSAAQMAEQLNAVIESQVRVSAIDTAAHTISVDGKTVTYSKLVLALGADQIRAPMEGDAVDAVLSVNDLGDYARFRAAVDGASRLLIIGAGLIGCEFANDLRGAGLAVEVVDPAKLPLGRLLPPRAAQAMHDALAEQGVVWHFGTTVQSLQHADKGVRATLSDGSTVAADVVLSAIGLRPRTALADAAGIRVNRGISVDKSLLTSAADVYALGDCAEVSGMVLPFVMPLMQAARALARTLSGDNTPVSYPAMPVVVKTPALPTVISPPAMGAEGRWVESGDGRNVRAVFEAPDGTALGFALTGSATAEKMALAKQMPAVLS